MTNTIDFAALIVALIALVTAIYFSCKQHQHNKNSLKPFIDFHFCHSDETIFVKFSNAGVGPMIIKSLTIVMDGTIVKGRVEGGSVQKSLISCLNNYVSRDLMRKYYNLDYGHIRSKDSVFSPNASFTLLSLTRKMNVSKNTKEFRLMTARLAHAIKRVQISVEFKDVYDTKFRKDLALTDFFGERYPELLSNEVTQRELEFEARGIMRILKTKK